MSALYGRTYLANLTECKESFKWDQRDFIYLSEIKETLFIQELDLSQLSTSTSEVKSWCFINLL